MSRTKGSLCARAVGASQMMGRSVRQQNFLGLLQMMSANPALMGLVNWANFARQAFGESAWKHYLNYGRTEQRLFDQVVTDYERRRMFERG